MFYRVSAVQYYPDRCCLRQPCPRSQLAWQYLLSNLGTSTLDAYGGIVDQYSGLPTAF